MEDGKMELSSKGWRVRFRCSVPAYDRIIDSYNFSSSSSVRFASDLAREIRERNPFRVGGRFLPPVADSRVARFGSLIEFRINYHGERESLLIITAIACKRNRGKDIFLEYRIESSNFIISCWENWDFYVSDQSYKIEHTYHASE